MRPMHALVGRGARVRALLMSRASSVRVQPRPLTAARPGELDSVELSFGFGNSEIRTICTDHVFVRNTLTDDILWSLILHTLSVLHTLSSVLHRHSALVQCRPLRLSVALL
ncbi:hypothetical protein BaRGS_00002004 [Batillaria attramentaria]|uniref:Uncharacterized protein n=1 Tax=Batillaria attramentaria TaxID=370345 RepID=A0ABD0M572_9CAEN